jgi:hypothetical protein
MIIGRAERFCLQGGQAALPIPSIAQAHGFIMKDSIDGCSARVIMKVAGHGRMPSLFIFREAE